jgi:hypothetical protein
LFVPSSPDPGWQGARVWTADNPPVGAVVTYHLRDAMRTLRAERQQAERAAARRGEDVFYPAWDRLRAEDLQEDPAIIVTVTDPEGRVVRRLTGPTGAGLQRVTWDLRYPSSAPVTSARPGAGGGGGFGGFGGGAGPYVVPGTYTVSLAKLVDGVLTPLGQPQQVEVFQLDPVATPRTAAALAFDQRASALQRAVLGANAAAGEAAGRVDLLRRALHETPGATVELLAEVRAIGDTLRAIQWALNGDPTMERRQETSPPSLSDRLRRISGGALQGSLGDPSGSQLRQYEIIAGEFGAILARLRRTVETDLKRVEDAAEAAGAPWTSGRIPDWRP